MANWIGGSLRRTLDAAAKVLTSDYWTEKAAKVAKALADREARKALQLVYKIQAKTVTRGDLYHLPRVRFNGQYTSMDGVTIYRWTDHGVRRVMPAKVRGKAAVKQAKRDRRASRERAAYLLAKVAS